MKPTQLLSGHHTPKIVKEKCSINLQLLIELSEMAHFTCKIMYLIVTNKLPKIWPAIGYKLCFLIVHSVTHLICQYRQNKKSEPLDEKSVVKKFLVQSNTD